MRGLRRKSWCYLSTLLLGISLGGCKPPSGSSIKENGPSQMAGAGGISKQVVPHALNDLSAEEVLAATKAVKESGKFTADARFGVVMTKEPTKAERQKGGPIARQASLVVYEMKKRELWEVTVDLAAAKVAAAQKVEGVEPPIFLDEYNKLSAIVKADQRWRAIMTKRGYSAEQQDKNIQVDGWAPGLLSSEEKASKVRLMRGLAYFKDNDQDNYYARPIEGVVATVDMTNEKVIAVTDVDQAPIAEKHNLVPNDNGPLRSGLKPLEVTMPQGPSFQVNGQEIVWEKWHFRYSMQPMKGLVLYDVGYEDGGKVRPIIYKISLAEMLVPYSDPRKTWSFRNAFDVGEYGIGRIAHTLLPAVDVPKDAVFFDANFATDTGDVLKMPRAVAVYEREGGLMWKHQDMVTNVMQARTARDLVATFMTTVGNYDYGVNYIFHQDGSIDIEAQLTGMLLPQGTTQVRSECLTPTQCNQLVDKNVIAPAHQHFFSFRIDFDIDGENNTPVEMNAVAVNSTDHNQFRMETTELKTEAEAARDLDGGTQRMWKVINRSKANALAHPVGYMLMPGVNSQPFLTPDSQIRQRARFVDHHAWFTAFHDDEQASAGPYPNQGELGAGLPAWAGKDKNGNEALADQDVVMWYQFGITHFPRPEEWPIMNVTRAGFKLAPINFFSRNPAMDLPPPSRSEVNGLLAKAGYKPIPVEEDGPIAEQSAPAAPANADTPVNAGTPAKPGGDGAEEQTTP